MANIVNPFRKVTCPYCHESYYPGECRIIATLSFNNIHADDILREGRKGLLARLFVVPLTGPHSVRMGAVRICPHCDMKQPNNVMGSSSYTIAIVGDGDSGKSHYLASLIHQLRHGPALQVIGCNAIIGQGNTDQLFYSNYYVPYFMNMNKRQVLSTQHSVVPEPLLYELVFPDKRVNLLFYDASGEDIINPNQFFQFSSYILNASAIIFLVDPMSIPEVVKSLPAHLHESSTELLRKAQIMNRMISTLKQHHSRSPNGNLRIPIAITISKSDLLEFVASSKLHGTHLETNQEVQDFLRRFGDTNLLKASESFETVSFFAVSATGWLADANGIFPSIEPRRCLEPLLWILWKLGVIAE